jgi:hypothetical protein
MAHLLRVGDVVINLETVTDIRLQAGNTGDRVEVNYSGDDQASFTGGQAEAIRRWCAVGANVEYCTGSGGTF